MGECTGRPAVGSCVEGREEDWKDRSGLLRLGELSEGRNKQMMGVQGEGFRDP